MNGIFLILLVIETILILNSIDIFAGSSFTSRIYLFFLNIGLKNYTDYNRFIREILVVWFSFEYLRKR